MRKRDSHFFSFRKLTPWSLLQIKREPPGGSVYFFALGSVVPASGFSPGRPIGPTSSWAM